MSRFRKPRKKTLLIWMMVNAVLLAVLSVWVMTSTGDGPAPKLPPQTGNITQPSAQAGPRIPDRNEILAQQKLRFGISTPEVPWKKAATQAVTDMAGPAPTMMQYFVKWTKDFDPVPVKAAYEQGAVPVLSWEPWAGDSAGDDQPQYALGTIIRGEHDQYINRFATAVRKAKFPVVIRLAHEMNGHWYPWSEKRSGNKPGEFAEAWRHIHGVFQQAGATNVIWVWSPNILRPVPNVPLEPLFPGDQYVDWVGLSGYAVPERTAAATFEPTMAKIRRFTQRPLLITETGKQPGSDKAAWTADFFSWIAQRNDVVGFIWFQYSKQQGGSADWRFNSDEATLKAFQKGIAALTLAPPIAI